jgi:hypothetical protein
MRWVIRIYALVALLALGAFLLIWVPAVNGGALPSRFTLRLVYLVNGVSLWILVVIPLGVLAGSAAARQGQRRWRAVFVALTVLAAIAPSVAVLLSTVHDLFIPPSIPTVHGVPILPTTPALDTTGALWSPIFTWVEWIAALLLVPAAALAYTLAPSRSAPGADMGRRGQRLILVGAICSLIIVAALGPTAIRPIPVLPSDPRAQQTVFTAYTLLHILWTMLSVAVPVAIASLALADAAWAGRRTWSVSLIVLGVVAVLATNLFTVVSVALDVFAVDLHGQPLPFGPLFDILEVGAPLALLLGAAAYALATRSTPHAPAVAAA